MAGTRIRQRSGGGGIWPWVLAPVGLTLIFGVCLWLFLVKAATDREVHDDDSRRLESYARVEASDIVSIARASAREFVAARRELRQSQERNLRVEAKGILDSAYKLLSLGLEKAGQKAAGRRDVGSFPPGFDGMRRFLEIAPPDPNVDSAVAALRADIPELSSLIPSGCSFAVIEDNAKELYSLGGGAAPAGAVSVSLTREFMFNDNGKNRHWSLRVELSSTDANPLPDAKETAERLSRDLSGRRLQDAAWRGWLIGPGDMVAGSFAASGEQTSAEPPFVNKPGEWLELEDARLVWLERPGKLDGVDWEPAVSVAIRKPAAPLDAWDALKGDSRWGLTLGALGLFTISGWIWFVLSALTPEPVPAAPTAAARTPDAAPRRRLVRDPERARDIPDVEGVIVADIDETGEVRLDRQPKRPAPMPSGSLSRLQTIHRGREGVAGSRILDHARSQILKDLASRVRPTAAEQPARPTGVVRKPAAEPMPSMKSVTGWRKVEDGK